jgi:hypothetical protein
MDGIKYFIYTGNALYNVMQKNKNKPHFFW